MGLFGKEPQKSPKDMVQEWRTQLRKESRQLDRQIRGIQREEQKTVLQIRNAAKKGDKDVCAILAKEVVRARKHVSKIYASKAQINSVILQMQNQLATARLAGALQKSTEVMQAMQQLIRLPEIQATMQELSKEMMKAGVIEEMLEDTLDSVNDNEDLEEETQQEVDKILFELTAGKLGEMPEAGSSTLPTPAASLPADDVDEDEEEDMEEMKQRLAALRS